EIIKKLEETITAAPNILKIGVAYSNTSELQSVCLGRKEGKIYEENLTQDNYAKNLVNLALKNNSGWTELELNEAIKNYTSVFYMPAYAYGGKKTVGTIYVEVSLTWLSGKIDSLKLEKKDFGIVLSKTGNILYHPLNNLIYGQTNIFKLLGPLKAAKKNFEKQLSIIRKAVNGESGEGYTVARTGEPFWYIYRPVKQGNWAMLINFTKNTVPLNEK
ncbi:MAG: hypothetical protein PHP17_07340, partial [Candidatus Omnitrophica bacterium]|nr:hypothetical protein [Candidatus Omnitrophota bacterium]